MEFNLADLFESVVDAVPDAPAVVAGPRRLTYAVLDLRANRLAHRLATAGIGPGDLVGIQLKNGSEYLEAMLACFKVRAIPVNVNFRYTGAELRNIYDDAALEGLIYHRAFAPAVET
ncbi:MAG TPA: AMP-binding protein, partial [Acidimicrobiales bacterium]